MIYRSKLPAKSLKQSSAKNLFIKFFNYFSIEKRQTDNWLKDIIAKCIIQGHPGQLLINARQSLWAIHVSAKKAVNYPLFFIAKSQKDNWSKDLVTKHIIHIQDHPGE